MPFAVGIKYSRDEFSKYFNPCDLKLTVDDYCIVKDPELGIERVGFVSSFEGRAPIQMNHLPKVVRPATEDEVEQWYNDKIREKESILLVRERAEAHHLPIKISSVTFIHERQQVLIHFTSDQRVDFREMVRDLAGHFKARIEMWQIGARKEAGLKDGIGICGNRLCCSNWIKDFPTISMRHAKDQDIVQPPSKLSGPCNKLRCCLRYEHEQYVALAVGAPALGCRGCSSGGACGVVADRSLLKQEVTVRTDGGDYQVFPIDQFTIDKNAPPPPRDERPRRGRRAPEEDDDAG